MARIKRLEPALATGILLMGELADPVSAARAVGAESIRPGWQYWTAKAVCEVNKAGFFASTWNADNESVMGRLLPMGIASIGSNYPDKLRAFVDMAGKGYR